MMSEASKRQAAFRLDLGSYRGEFAAEYDDPLFIEAISRPEEIWTRPDTELILDKRNPAGYLEKRKRGLGERSFFFAARVDGAEEIRGLFRRLPAVELEPLLPALAAFLSQCHDRGILHRDLSAGNVLVGR